MKVTVINAFIDKNTGEPYNSGAIYESTDKERIKELQDGGFLAAPEKVSKENNNQNEPPKE